MIPLCSLSKIPSNTNGPFGQHFRSSKSQISGREVDQQARTGSMTFFLNPIASEKQALSKLAHMWVWNQRSEPKISPNTHARKLVWVSNCQHLWRVPFLYCLVAGDGCHSTESPSAYSVHNATDWSLLRVICPLSFDCFDFGLDGLMSQSLQR